MDPRSFEALRSQLPAHMQNMSQSQLQNTLERKTAEQKSQHPSRDRDNSAEGNSSPESVRSENSARERTVYQDMLLGNTVDPDSALTNLEVYGYRVFNNGRYGDGGSEDMISVPGNYVIGSGDQIVLTMWGRINEEHQLLVDRDGKIRIPRIGPMFVAGFGFRSVEKKLVERIQTIEGVNASVTMGPLRSVSIFVVGEVRNPGQYTVSALSNVVGALFASGGITRNGSLRHVKLMRNGKTVTTFDLYQFLMFGDNFNKVRLKAGDVIMVPVLRKMAAIAGNVRRGALYELEGKTSLSDLISLAGGLSATAWVNRIQVERYDSHEYRSVLDLEAENAEDIPDFEILDADIVKIYPIALIDRNAVFLEGNVWRPGKYELEEGMRIADLVGGFDGLLPETYYNYAVVTRTQPPNHYEEVLSFNLRSALMHPESQDNITLETRDEVMVYHRDFFEPDRYVTVGGAVTSPGEYKLLENMRIKDLILKAGGLKDYASATRGELYRRQESEDSVRTESFEFCVECAMDGDSLENISLEKMDNIIVRRKRGWEEEKSVALIGEFVYSGTYVLLDGESLGELIGRAGGFTPDAFLDAAILTRKSVKDRERKRNLEYQQKLQSDMEQLSIRAASMEDPEEARRIMAQQSMLLQQLQDTRPVGRVVINLGDKDSYEDFLLEDRDTLMIPTRNLTVSVLGEVQNPSTFQMSNRETTVDYFVQMAGGYTDFADNRRIYVVKANGSVRTRKMVNIRRYSPGPGDAIIVPQRIRYKNGYRTFLETVDAAFKLTTVAAMVTTSMATIRSLK